jgi:O-antigen/teichoic acid export membrane protein
MTEIKTLYKHALHYLGGQIGGFLVGLVSFPVFTRVFSVAEYGLISLTLATVSIANAVSKLGMQHSVLRFYSEYAQSSDPNSGRRYCSTLFWATAGIAAGLTVAFILGVACAPAAWISPGLRKLLLLAAVLIFIRATNSTVMNLWRAEGRSKTFNMVEVATRAGTVAVICTLLFTWERDPRVFFTGMIVVEALVMLFVTVSLRRRNLLAFGEFESKCFKLAFAFGIPWVVSELAGLVLDTGDRYFVQYYLGSKALGRYSAAYNFSGYLQQAVTVPLSLAIFPIYMKIWVTKGKEETQSFLSRSLDHFVMVAIGLVACVVVAGRDAFVFLSSRKFEEGYPLLPILVAGLLVYGSCTFLYAGLNIHKRTSFIARMIIYSCGLNMALNVWLIPRIGLQGAAISTLVSYAFLAVLLARESLALLPLRLDALACARYVVAGTLAALMVSRLSFHYILLNLVVKGLSFVALYVGILWLIDRRIREFAAGLVRQPLPPAFGPTPEPVRETEMRLATKDWRKAAGTP